MMRIGRSRNSGEFSDGLPSERPLQHFDSEETSPLPSPRTFLGTVTQVA